MNDRTPVIAAHNLSRVFGNGEQSLCLFEHLDFEIQSGEKVAIVGESGSGKSTLLQTLGGLDRPTSGTVSIKGQNLAGLSDTKLGQIRNAELGFVYQFHHLIKELSAVENVMLPAMIGGLRNQAATDVAMALLDEVGLDARAEHMPGQLSGGERQRVAICRALVNQPSCVLADEPTGNLDEDSANTVFELFMRLSEVHGTALIMVTHSMDLARRADRIMLLSGGQLQPFDSP